MTVMAERTSQMSVEEFETIAAAAPETVTLEFVDGRSSHDGQGIVLCRHRT